MASGPTVRGVLDTSTIILLERITDVSTLPEEPMITAVTLAELSVGPLVASNPQEQAIRQLRLQQAEADFRPLPFDAAAARSFGRVAASLRRGGRKSSARAFDAMIAATAISNDLPLFTCNPSDFENIDDLDLRPIPHPDNPSK
ncbi:MAG: PIN domain-containing protein [Acidimicrobiales bacterium]